MRLHLESLEDRRALAAYTTRVLDPDNLVSADVESKMLANLEYAMRNASNFVSWKGTLDAQVRVRPMMSGYEGGVASSIDSDMPGNRSGTVYEMLTGTDPNGSLPDLGADFWVARDGTVKVYGMSPWYDPAPSGYVPADVPAGSFDFVGVLTHELFHGFGFRQTVDFTKYVTTVNGNPYFNGPNTVALLGRSLPMAPNATHYGNTGLPDNPVGTGLMFQWGNYGGNRLDIGKLDLAILKDLGHTIRNTDGLPLVDVIDSVMPKMRLTNTVVSENLPPGSFFGMVTPAGPGNFSFSLPQGLRDNGSFRIVGNNIVTNAQIDYETKNSYTIEVRNTDPAGVWTHRVFTIGVRDMDDTPRIVAPSRIFVNSATDLGFLQVSGEYGKFVSVSVFAWSGSFKSSIKDPAVWVSFARPRAGGTVVTVMGSLQAVSRNMKFITYTGLVGNLNVTLGHYAGSEWITEQKTVKLETVFRVPRMPVAGF